MQACPQCGAEVPSATAECKCGYLFSPADAHAISSAADDPATPGQGRQRGYFAFIAIVIIVLFVSRLASTNAEREPASMQALQVFLDLGMAVGLVGTGRSVLRSMPPGTPGRGGWLFLFVTGIIAVIGFFVLRLASGLPRELPPRAFQPAQTESIPADLERFATRCDTAVAAFKKARADFDATLWQRTDEAEIRKLSREDFRDYLAKLDALNSSIDRIVQLLSEPDAEANFNRAVKLGASYGIPGAANQRFDLRPWKLRQQLFAKLRQFNRLIEENWEEWRAAGIPESEGARKPWQKELLRGAAEVAAVQKALAELAEAPNSPAASSKPAPDPQAALSAELMARLKARRADCDRLRKALEETRWGQTEFNAPGEGAHSYGFATAVPSALSYLRKLAREDLAKFRQTQRALLDSLGQVLGLYQEAEQRGLARFTDEAARDFSWSDTIATARSRPANWRAVQRMIAAAYAQSGIIEENWEDWRRSGLPSKGRLKPWQEKMQQLQREFDAAFAEWKSLR